MEFQRWHAEQDEERPWCAYVEGADFYVDFHNDHSPQGYDEAATRAAAFCRWVNREGE